jgi:hypothetical protein
VRVTVIASCTKRKKLQIPQERTVRGLRPIVGIREAAQQWTNRLQAPADLPKLASDVYAGDYWRAVQAAKIATASAALDVWVLSAGYGLIRDRAPLVGYSATFSTGHSDDIGTLVEGRSRRDNIALWWSEIERWRGPEPGQARSVTELGNCPCDAFVFLVSPGYLRVVEHDLRRLVDSVGRDRVAIFSAGLRDEEFAGTVMRYNASLQTVVGGGLNSLNARVFSAAIAKCHSAVPSELQKALDDLSTRARPRAVLDRRRATDEQIFEIIESDIAEHGASMGWSAALRHLRDKHDIACEQKRFRALYKQRDDESLGFA